MRVSSVVLGVLGICGWSHTMAQDCTSQTVYTGNTAERPVMDELGRTWPEAPEQVANWGEKDGMVPPYLRLSGQTNTTRDWSGTLSFAALPVQVQGGNLELQVHPTVAARFTVWVVSDAGSSSPWSYDLPANSTTDLRVPLALLGLSFPAKIHKIGVQFDQVPAYQYTTVFLDRIGFSCVDGSGSSADSVETDTVPLVRQLAEGYPFSDLEPWKPARAVPESLYVPEYAYTVKDESTFVAQRERSLTGIVVSLEESQDLVSSLAATPENAEESSRLWFRNTHVLSRGRLRDSVIANPQYVFQTADQLAASYNYRLVPLVMADIDYESEPCLITDDLDSNAVNECAQAPYVPMRYTHVSLPVAAFNGSRVVIVNDPVFFTTNRQDGLPSIDLRVDGVWHTLAPRTAWIADFPWAGKHTIVCRFQRGNYKTENTIVVEVR